ncbi:MAG: thymidylate synthase [Promethearchaeota archaeon]|jgi:thymidylate synthase
MKYRHIKAFDIPDGWYRSLETIWQEGDNFYVGYGSEITETKKLNITLEIENPHIRPLIADKAPCDMKYVTSYALQYLWLGVKEEGETYTYGGRLRDPIDQVEIALNRFIEEPRDRQVVLLIRRPEDLEKHLAGMKHEPPCLTILDLEIMDETLNTTGYFRSWDAYAGLPANLAGIQIFLEAFVDELNRRTGKKYKTGKMIFHCKNCHIYSRLKDFIEELTGPEEDSRRQTLKKKLN